MTSRATSTTGSINSTSRRIPLVCTVCPDNPRFSDTSHLLTHIASKGHLHHETQTKLKAHQDADAVFTLHQYEQWYREHNIEALLVDRLKAKQAKEAARTRRIRSIASLSRTKNKKRPKKARDTGSIKIEEDATDNESYPELFIFDDKAEDLNEPFVGSDMLSLKGQVWPGMGKMDLASEEMKRTRNQRKPKSAIDKMKRTSEAIKPTQVVMTSNFEVEREKDVYDPPSEEEDSTPPRKAVRRNRVAALRNLPPNVPKRGAKSLAGQKNGIKKPKLSAASYSALSPKVLTSVGIPFRNPNDVFGEDDRSSGTSSPFDLSHLNRGYGTDQTNAFVNRSFQGSSQYDQRSRLPALNPIAQFQSASPTPITRDAGFRQSTDRSNTNEQSSTQSYFDSFSNTESQYSMQDIYNHDRLSFHQPSDHMDADTTSGFHLSPSALLEPKQEDFPDLSPLDNVEGPTSNQFLNMATANPLFSHDRLFVNSYSDSLQNPTFTSLAFTPISQSQAQEHTALHDDEQLLLNEDTKAEHQYHSTDNGRNNSDPISHCNVL